MEKKKSLVKESLNKVIEENRTYKRIHLSANKLGELKNRIDAGNGKVEFYQELEGFWYSFPPDSAAALRSRWGYNIKLQRNIFTDMKKNEKGKILVIKTLKDLNSLHNYEKKYVYENFSGVEVRSPVSEYKNYGVIFDVNCIKDIELFVKKNKQKKYALWDFVPI